MITKVEVNKKNDVGVKLIGLCAGFIIGFLSSNGLEIMSLALAFRVLGLGLDSAGLVNITDLKTTKCLLTHYDDFQHFIKI